MTEPTNLEQRRRRAERACDNSTHFASKEQALAVYRYAVNPDARTVPGLRRCPVCRTYLAQEEAA